MTATGRVNPDPKNTPRQRRFDQKVADILNGLVDAGILSPTPGGGWTITPPPGGDGDVLSGRAFGFTPRYGQVG